MSLSAAVLDALAASGVSREQIIAAVKADIVEREAAAEAKLEAKRAGNRERQQRKRAKSNAQSRDVTHVTRDGCDVGFNERDNLTSREDLPQEPNGSLPQGAKHPKSSARWLCPPDVDPQHWSDLMANRKRKRCAQTQTAYDAFLADIAELADDEWPPGRLVEHAAAKGWASINDPRTDYGKRPHSERKSGWETAYAANIGSISN